MALAYAPIEPEIASVESEIATDFNRQIWERAAHWVSQKRNIPFRLARRALFEARAAIVNAAVGAVPKAEQVRSLHLLAGSTHDNITREEFTGLPYEPSVRLAYRHVLRGTPLDQLETIARRYFDDGAPGHYVYVPANFRTRRNVLRKNVLRSTTSRSPAQIIKGPAKKDLLWKLDHL